jgi:seryl-tRNA synthetase
MKHPNDALTRIELQSPVPEALAAEIERRLYFVSPEITGYELVVKDHEVHGVVLYSPEPLDHAALTAKVDYMVDNDVRRQRVTPARSVWTSPHRRAPQGDIFDLLAESGAVTEVGEGQVALGEPLLSLFTYFDKTVCDLLAEDFDAREYRYPTLIRTKALETAGYMKSFPQHLMFVTRLRNDLDVYRDFQDSHAVNGLDSEVLGSCGNVDYCLPPTMCYHTFQQYGGRTVEADRLHVVTSRGKSFRFEAAYSTTLERLWDFTIREIVFMGAREDVLNSRERFMRKVFAFVETLGMSGFCVVGNDPFFCGTDTSERIWSQRLMELKYELRLDVAPERTIAVGSFNFHDDLFGKAFGIDHGANGPVRSGCVGFGLERLVYAFLCQYGLDSADWPAQVRSAVVGS